MKKTILMMILILGLTIGISAQDNPYGYTQGAEIYSETFDSAASLTNFTQAGTGQYTIEYLDFTGKKVYGGPGDTGGCDDDSTVTYIDFDIPVAPNSGDASKNAIRMYVNPDTGAASQSVANLYTNTSFSGDYRIKVDMFCRINGPVDYGGSGSTENGIVGVGHSGTKINNQQQDGDAENPTDTDGYFIVMNGERGTGSTGDVVLFEGDPAAKDVGIYLVNVLSCGDVDQGTAVGTGLGIGTGNENEWLDLFPYDVTTWRYRGSPGDGWITMIIDSLSVGSSRVTVIYIDNGTAVAEVKDYADLDATYESGKILLGMEDRFTSQNAPDESYIIYDNLTVYELDAPVILSTDVTWSLYE